jgi:cytochrome P450
MPHLIPCDCIAKEEAVISRSTYAGSSAWSLTGYDDVRGAITDRRFAPFMPGLPGPDEMADGGMLFLMNGPRHVRLRRMVSGAFSARRVAVLRPAVERIAGERLAAFHAAAAPGDLLTGFAAPLAIGTLSELLGIAIADRPDFAAWSDDATAMFGAASTEDAEESSKRLGEFIADLVDSRRAAPGDDLISALVAAQDDDGVDLTDAELNGVSFAMLLAGYLPPAQAIATGTLRLLREPAVIERLRAEPGLVPATVEELLRLDPGGTGPMERALRATEDVEVAGTLVRADEIVVVQLGVANRDPARFPDPDRIDPTRTDNPHLTFAPGPHHCLGAALARTQLEAGIGALVAGLPGLALAVGEQELVWHADMTGQRTLTGLPVTWRNA